MVEELTWPCEICRSIRPDDKINVLTYPLKGFEKWRDLGGEADRNLKYCNDNPDCQKKALAKANSGTP